MRLAIRSLSRRCRHLSTHASSTRYTSANPDEIAHFSRLSAHWWDERGEFALLHKMNPVRMKFIQDKLLETARHDDMEDSGYLRGKEVLDIGCGGGLLSESLTRLGARTLGVDASQSNIAIATHHASLDPNLSSLTYQHTTAEALLGARQYDVVCAMEVIEHVENPPEFLQTCAQLVKPGGHLFLSTISRTPLSYLLTIVLAEHTLRLVTPGTHTFSKFIKPSELVDFFRSYSSPCAHEVGPWIALRSNETNMCPRTEAEVRGIVYNPWLGQWSLVPRHWSSSSGQNGLGEMCNYLFWVRRPLG